MLYLIFLTGRCNLKCKYCGGTIPKEIMPFEVTYSIKELKDFLSTDKNPSIAFYGGEPLLRIKLMEKIMDKIDAEHFILQTNGIFLNKVKKEYINKFSTILVSIDGRREINDFYRGEGTYDKVLENVKKLNRFYEGELIARMVATEKTNIYREVKHLLSLGLFTHIHWQINAVWYPLEKWKNFRKWVENYNQGISKLICWWVNEAKKGNLFGIVPFLGVLKALLGYKNNAPPCGAGKDCFSITTDGRILACPICADLEWNNLGNLKDGITKKVEILEPCRSCKYFEICGGRCLFFNRERSWGEEGFNLVCFTVRHLIEEIKKVKDDIIGLYNKKEIIYPKFNNTTEIIP